MTRSRQCDVNGRGRAHFSVLAGLGRSVWSVSAAEELQWEQRRSERTDRGACCAYHAAPRVWEVISAAQPSARETQSGTDFITGVKMSMLNICNVIIIIIDFFLF